MVKERISAVVKCSAARCIYDKLCQQAGHEALLSLKMSTGPTFCLLTV